MEDNCLFCDSWQMGSRIILDSRYWFVIKDNSPVSMGHVLIILKRHTLDMFDITLLEWRDFQDILEHSKKHLDEQFDPDGYNVGVNCGEAAGQTIFHLHVHLIPRYKGDVENPRGGIRNFKKPLVEY